MSEASAKTPTERIVTALRAAAKHGQPALVAFLTAGYPERSKFREHLTAIASAADVVEIGVPFSDPMADGITIQRSSEAALRAGVTLTWILEELQLMSPVAAPLMLMSYMNPLLAFGLERLARRAVGAGICGFIVPDLPLDESEELRAILAPYNLALVQMVTPVTTSERLARLATASQGFVYAVTMAGTTGKNMASPEDIAGYLERGARRRHGAGLRRLWHPQPRTGRAPARPGRRRHRRLGAGRGIGARRVGAGISGGVATTASMSAGASVPPARAPRLAQRHRAGQQPSQATAARAF